MKIVVIGAGAAGLYLAILMKRADPRHQVTVVERNRADDTFGFGVVFSDATLDNFLEADPITHTEITQAFAHWDAIDVHYQGEVLTSRGHGFSGLGRQKLLSILQRRARSLGVTFAFSTEATEPSVWRGADLVVAADGVNSWVRAHFAAQFEPQIDWRPNRFVWLGTTCPFPAFTFIFKETDLGLWRVHAYRYEEHSSTFILETTEETWRRAGLDTATEDETVAFTEKLFARELGGHPVLKNRSLWRSFPTVRNRRWHHDNVVLVGDAAHTAHFSIGSGTKLAMEDSIALARALGEHRELTTALAAYEAERRPQVETLQRAAQTSLEWFEHTERYHGRLEYHEPWHLNREISHLMRGLVDAFEADALLEEHGHGELRLVDNGAIVPRTTLPDLPGPPHVYHLIPRQASKADAVVRHMRARAYAPEECIAVGDSREDLGVAHAVGRFFLVANAVEKDPDLLRAAPPNVEVTEGSGGEGFYEAVITALAERR